MFPAHGWYSMRVEDRTLVIDAYGPWNLEAAKVFDSEVRRLASAHLAPDPWAMVAILHGDGIYTPDSIDLLHELHAWRIANGLRHLAVVHSPERSSEVTEEQFNRVYEADPDAICDERYFDSAEEAFSWLRANGYTK